MFAAAGQANTLEFKLFVYDRMKQQAFVTAEPMMKQDAAKKSEGPKWQADWNGEYIAKSEFDIYGLKTWPGELVGLGGDEINGDTVTVYVVYMESQAERDPTLFEQPKYHGLRCALIAYGIKRWPHATQARTTGDCHSGQQRTAARRRGAAGRCGS